MSLNTNGDQAKYPSTAKSVQYRSCQQMVTVFACCQTAKWNTLKRTRDLLPLKTLHREVTIDWATIDWARSTAATKSEPSLCLSATVYTGQTVVYVSSCTKVQLQHPVALGGASSPRRLTPRCCWAAELTAGSVLGNFLAAPHHHMFA